MTRRTRAFIAGRMSPTGKGLDYLGELMKQAPDKRLKEIEETLLIHNELAKSQNEWLIARVKWLTEALEVVSNDLKCIHYVRARKALEEE